MKSVGAVFALKYYSLCGTMTPVLLSNDCVCAVAFSCLPLFFHGKYYVVYRKKTKFARWKSAQRRNKSVYSGLRNLCAFP